MFLGQLHEEILRQRFGSSTELSKSVAKTMSRMYEETPAFHCDSSTLEAAKEVASCHYEFETSWGKDVSLMSQ